ncbi:uncharacterized protein [Ptychodera flava]|uniref:uncharacterized protein n=1 Tax=Ptychodera flava TaxID=63121 RepID=UPI00396A5864
MKEETPTRPLSDGFTNSGLQEEVSFPQEESGESSDRSIEEDTSGPSYPVQEQIDDTYVNDHKESLLETEGEGVRIGIWWTKPTGLPKSGTETAKDDINMEKEERIGMGIVPFCEAVSIEMTKFSKSGVELYINAVCDIIS